MNDISGSYAKSPSISRRHLLSAMASVPLAAALPEITSADNSDGASTANAVLMGMGLEEANQDGERISVLTPGCAVILDANHVLHVRQRIGADRELLCLPLDGHFAPWRIAQRDSFQCTLEGNGLHIVVQGDSILIFQPQQNMKLSFQGFFDPVYRREIRGNRLLLDETGGCGLFGIPPRPTQCLEQEKPWTLGCHLARWDELWISVCPPRREDERRMRQSISHDILYYLLRDHEMTERYASRASLEDIAKHCQVLALHEEIWKDAPAWVEDPPGGHYDHPKPWETDRHEPYDPEAFARMLDDAHQLGLQVVVYCSPYYSNAPNLLAEFERVLNEYQLDGLYFDGWCPQRDDFRPGYQFMRQARALLGEKILYLHSSTDPFGSVDVYLPFVFTYADFCLRGEAGRGESELEAFLRYSISGHQISNSVGTWCYYGSTGAAGYQFVVPTSAHVEAALRNHVRLWRQSRMWSRFPEELARFDREYYGAINSSEPLNTVR